MSRIKDLIDNLNYERPNWLIDAEYQEWLEWCERPTIYDTEKSISNQVADPKKPMGATEDEFGIYSS